MSIHEKIRSEAKLDSRRFGKSIVCKIVYGELLAYLERHGLVPNGIRINSETGLDPVNNKMFVLPMPIYLDIIRLMGNTESNINQGNLANLDINQLAKIEDSAQILVNALQQNLILITVHHNIPEGIRAGSLPEVYDIMIDSIDVNQSIEGTYVYTTTRGIAREKDL